MSAQPLPRPDPEPAPGEPAAADAEGWALLEALRRRLDDQGALSRKTAAQVHQLAESIGALVAEQRRRATWANLNSFVAYVIFTVLVGAGFYMLYRSRAHELVEARDAAQRERDQAVKRADDVSAKAVARDKADGAAWEVYQLLEVGKRSEAAGKLGALADLPLSRTERAVLAARAHETQVMEVDAALKAAATAFKAGRHADVIAPLEAALVSEPIGARATTMRYYLGVAYAKTNDLAKATALLGAAVAGDVDQEDARFQLASVLDRAGQFAKARTEYDRFATAHPQSQLAVFAMRRSATLARMPAVAPGTPAVTTTTTPATTAPAPKTAPTATPGPTAAPALPPPAPANVAPAKTAPAKAAPANAAPAKTAPAKTAPAKAAAAKTVIPKAAPAQDAPAVEPSADAAPMSRGVPARDPAPSTTEEPRTPKLEPAPRANTPPPQLPSFDIDRTPPPSPLGPPVDREPAPATPSAPRGEQAPPPLRFSTPTDKAPAKPAPAKPAPPAPAPAKPAPDAPKLPPPPRADTPPPQLPSFDIDRTPPPSPLGPPVDREPAPAPQSPPRGEPRPPPLRF